MTMELKARKKRSRSTIPEKKLTLQQLKKLDRNNDTTEAKTIGGYKVVVNKVFRATKIQELLAELLVIQDAYQKEGFGKHLQDTNAFFFLLLIQYFTDIDVPESAQDKLAFLNMLIDNHLLQPLIETLDRAEIDKVLEAMKQATIHANNAIEAVGHLRE